MSAKPLLGDWEIPRISRMETLEERAFVELPIPGKTASLLQDLDTDPTRIVIEGSLYGEETLSPALEEIRGKFADGEPLTFVADILKATSVEFVVVEVLHFEESASEPGVVNYSMRLKESPPPPPPPDPLGAIDDGLLDQAGDLIDSVTGALDVLDGIPDLEDPTGGLTDALSGVDSALGELDGVTSSLTDLFGSD